MLTATSLRPSTSYACHTGSTPFVTPSGVQRCKLGETEWEDMVFVWQRYVNRSNALHVPGYYVPFTTYLFNRADGLDPL